MLILQSGRRCGPKSLQPLLQYALANGWRVGLTNGGQERPVIHTSSTPSDWRAVRNAVAMLARADRKEVILV
ncbi:hypothetical protein L4O36_000187 [Pseudomonas aeruginosa]|nr:hypothetical protein [Pseudomonas aeruginosa]EKX7106289.1 hypothetical protein [Pseudomonas aeruginosa]ELK4907717.1 hypothetical protein [Pseudomonas aeruginosa]MBM2543477.1 hypothetical protein [Pseudomonas aeruginosa]MBO3827389.1 hypothetical protein [Pseudomonas aeruginosa]